MTKKVSYYTLKWFWKVSKGQRGAIFLNCTVGVLGVTFSLIFVWVSKQVIDIATGTVTGSLITMSIIAASMMLFQLICNMIETWLLNKMQVDGKNKLKKSLFTRLLQSRWNELEKYHTGDVINRIEQDTTAVISMLTSSLPVILITAIQFIASFIFFCTLDNSLPWIILGIIPILMVAGRLYMKRMKKYTHDIRQSDSKIQSVIQESIQHNTIIKTLEQGGQNIERLDELQDTLRTQVYDKTRFSILSKGSVMLGFSGGYVLTFLWGAFRLSNGTISFGVMTAFLQLVGKIQRPFLDMARAIPTVINAITAAERLIELENLTIEEEGEKIFFDQTPDISIDNITFSYKEDERAIFKNYSLDIPAGSQIAITGETGRGKTTLIRLLLALSSPQSGKIILKQGDRQEPVSPLTRSNFVYVPQGNTLFSGTIKDNLLMGKPDASEQEMGQALKIAVADFVFDLPGDINYRLAEAGGGLSEGQIQRISIARALLRPGKILLLDEATSALDPETERKLVENLRNLDGKTAIFITHHPELANTCDRIVTLDASPFSPLP